MDELEFSIDGPRVGLTPLMPEHSRALYDIGRDESLWKWTPGKIATQADMDRYVLSATEARDRGVEAPFVVTLNENGELTGSTRFMNIDRRNRRAEIGATWLAPRFQRSYVNTECKYLLLRHAFEVWGCVRVELKTDVLNDKSRRAIVRIGAVEEGILRQHMITSDGRLRDTVYYSILDREWPEVKRNLLEMLSKY